MIMTMMTATVESPPAAASLDFAGNLHLLADVAIAQDEAEKAAALDREILSLRRVGVAAAKLAREKRVLDKFMGDIKKKDYLKLAASVMPWTPLPAAGHKRKRETSSHSPEPIIINRKEEEEEEEKQAEKKKKKLIIKIKTPSSANNDSSPKQSTKQRVDDIFVHHQGPATGMPERFKNKIRELAGPDAIIAEEKLLIEKALTESDTKLLQGRLTMPERSMAEREFLREDEKRLVRLKVGNRLEGIDATLIDPLLGRWGVKLRRWNMEKGVGKRSSVSYAINDGWNKVLKALHWEDKKGDGIVVQVWSIRVNGRLWVAVARP
ncbi:unnamed protein product [Cuscuta campestris]|uniref:Uncharacterized protein n=1 Tax=Cuscuta campestris TaxID=132261 RepID=A0A484K5P9_9ASTE|nr:unnamed protein product [Cuscuta campestris]